MWVKLQTAAEHLEGAALERLRSGDEEAARSLLKEKRNVDGAIEKNKERAKDNYALAALLAKKIAMLAPASSTQAAEPAAAPPAAQYGQQFSSSGSYGAGAGSAQQWGSGGFGGESSGSQWVGGAGAAGAPPFGAGMPPSYLSKVQQSIAEAQVRRP